MVSGDFEGEIALALHAGDGECVAVNATEEVGLGVQTGAEVCGVQGLFGDGVAADVDGLAVSWRCSMGRCI